MTLKDELITRYLEQLQFKNYCIPTLRNYSSCVSLFIQYVLDKYSIATITTKHAREYLIFKQSKGSSWSTINNYYSAFKILFTDILRVEWDLIELPRPRKENKLPNILSKDDIKSIIENTKKYRDFTLFTFLYATGMRVSEALKLKIDQIDSSRMQFKVMQGKGHKDRMVDIPESLLHLMRDYYKSHKPITFLFNGEIPGQPLVIRTVQNAFVHA